MVPIVSVCGVLTAIILDPLFVSNRVPLQKLNYHNNLPQSIALSIQGLQASGELFGGAAKILKKGESWAPIIPINQPAATCWYRSATLANSAYQTYRGIVGMWLIEDDQSLKSQLPHKYGVDDIPLILQDMEFNGDGLQLFKQNQPHFVGNRLLVNGQEAPYLDDPSRLGAFTLTQCLIGKSL